MKEEIVMIDLAMIKVSRGVSFLAIILTILIVAVASPSFAKEKAVVHEPRVIKLTPPTKIAQFTGRVASSSQSSCDDMALSEKEALRAAQSWLDGSGRNVKSVSLSLTGNYYGRDCAHGFSTATILYTEK